MSQRALVIGTRGSHLARWQADHVRSRLETLGHPTVQRIIRTKGDREQDLSFDKMEGKGFFTKEIEAELLAGTIDLAVHSCKDLETRDPEGLRIAAIVGRAATAELLVIRPEALDMQRPLELKEGAVIGTSSARRKSQLRMFRPDVSITDLRGNVPTRVEKLRRGDHDAILVARAGIDRLGLDLSDMHVRTLDPRVFIPAPAQGALAVQTRIDDPYINGACASLHDADAALCVRLERAVLFDYRGGCQVPLGAHAIHNGTDFTLWVSAAREWNETPVRAWLTGADTAELAAEAVRRVSKRPASMSVMITRTHDPDGLLARVLAAHGLSCSGVELLAPEPLPFALPQGYDRIFFTSRNAVRFFVKGGGSLNSVPCDAIGAGTAEELRRHGAAVDHVGDGPDTPNIAMEYMQRFGGQRVLFPCAEKGLRTVQKAMPDGNAMDLHVYRMRAVKDPRIEESDIVIVTSPEHASALHAARPLTTYAHRIAMGTSTAARIRELSGADAVVPWASNEMALIDAVFNIATS